MREVKLLRRNIIFEANYSVNVDKRIIKLIKSFELKYRNSIYKKI